MTLDCLAYHWCVLCLAGGVVMMRETCSVVSDSSSGGGGGKAIASPTRYQPASYNGRVEEGGSVMATSRTGTARWKNLRKQELAAAFERGDMRCPICFVAYDWHRSKQPNSPELDHVTAHAEGGKDVVENTRVICRQCNQRLGGKLGGKRSQARKTIRIAEPIRPKTTLIL